MSRGDKTSADDGRSARVCLILACTALGLAIAVTAFTLLDRGRIRFSPEATVDLQPCVEALENVSPPPPAATSVLRVAIAPVISPEASLELYADLIACIADSVGMKPVLLRGKNYSEVNDLIRMRQCDVAMVCTYSYVLAQAGFDVRLLAAPEIDGQRVYHSLIIVPATSKVVALSGLKDRRFASCDVLSTSGWLYPVVALKRQGIDAEGFFGKHIISGSHDRSVFAVKSGVVDAAAVDSIVYEHMLNMQPSLKAELKVIHRSPPFGMPPLVVPADLPPDQFARMQQVLLTMHTEKAGQRILKSLGFDRFFAPQDEDYDSVRDLHVSWTSHP
ncbi:MAG: phosphate/phosphite/phosphonate ABC transporter substrate-binding protein [Verrucomicrobia bacterium]|jgi:phosphonate transport system substrate-binding protein|nr:phosphate/phosphite/phosphonate ABC transporter substrate-binding protein [Verrucomicrobiota bacterium]MBT7065280.1 phosphate/phosphite/phosphonate ABC transporter substrate-binding protein [Verrucomicrobiota bacterium]MBT7700221.1 phosphate/phosphite/phosphonate ABC transporter substrate-binding protein [Verrucomicrobiota bacterium]